jgi:hypothetical protein
MVSIAHASALEREMVAAGMELAPLSKWALTAGGELYYLQTLVDLRREPRWFPDFISANQLRLEWIARVALAATRYRTHVPSGELHELLFGAESDSVGAHFSFPESWLPGPLEGGMKAVADIPSDLETQIRASLAAEELAPHSFFGLVNASLVFRIDSQLSDLAAQGLKRVGYQLRKHSTNNEPVPLIRNLAMVAAVTRSKALAGEVRVLDRVARRLYGSTLSPEASLRIALISAAANADSNEWGEFVGEWLIELAFSEMTMDQAIDLKETLRLLLHIEPPLWSTCGRAEAALSSFIASFPKMGGEP